MRPSAIVVHGSAAAALLPVLLSATPLAAQGVSHNLMPVPASITLEPGGLPLDARFAIGFDGRPDAILQRAVERTLLRITTLTGIPIVRTGGTVALTIRCARRTEQVQAAIEDESYTLKITPAGAALAAPTSYGVLRGLETFVQLIEAGPGGFVVRAATIADRPRFPWRGLLIDVCRHWMPVEVIERNLDAMAAVKLNVLHWHLSEDQGFRVESRLFPLLQGKGSDGLFYTQAQVREVVRYAADRGIRVVPEFDMPGHTGAWLAGYPWLSSGRGPYDIVRTWGVFDPVLDPTNERVYAFLDKFIGEMATLFPDAYFHIGGDEVNGRQWNASPAVAAFRKRHRLKSNDDLQAYFNRRVSDLLRKRGKVMVGWDEVLHEDLPKTAVVQSWRGQTALADTLVRGYRGLLSNGYYLDYLWPAARHYAVDPAGKDAAGLPEEAKARILGGEACMWAEWVTPETVDSRIWPRAAAIAERFWSPATVTDTADMYRRLDVVSQRLDAAGVLHRANYVPMLERLAGYRPAEALKRVVDLVEPVKDNRRSRRATLTSLTPLNRLADAARPESDQARAFAQSVKALLADPARTAGRDAIVSALRSWQDDARAVQPVLDAPLLQESQPLVHDLTVVSSLGLRAIEALEKHAPLTLSAEETDALDKAAAPVADVLLMVAAPVRMLVEAASRAQ